MCGPQLSALVSPQQTDGGQASGADGGRQRSGEDEAAAVAADHVHQRGRGRNEAADVTVRLPWGVGERGEVEQGQSRGDGMRTDCQVGPENIR